VPLSAGVRLGPYEVLEPLGSGGMGEVYRARDPRLGRDVAVKLVTTDGPPSPDRLRRFETEARAAAQLSHPNVVTVFDVGTHDGHPYLVLELLEGQTLREELHREPPTLRDALRWALECARGLGAAHERGIVHRDLKPENVFLTKDGRVKVLDFGLAKLHEPLVSGEADRESPTQTRKTRPGMVLGTIGYMAPEQVRGETPDPRTDVFALGALLYELATGRRAFGGTTQGDVLAAILRDEPPAVTSLNPAAPPSLETVLRRCLAKRPAERFSSAVEVAAALEAVMASVGPGRAARPPERRGPYPGLESFRESDAESFFGREGEVAALWNKLPERRLLAVIGPSGVGKTSFMRAGVLAARPPAWASIVCAPGAHPFRSLGQALAPQLASDPEALQQLLGFEEEETAFELMRTWRKAHPEALLVVDQFEELFTLAPEDAQGRFAALLGRLAHEADIHVVLSLRDDFLMRCGEHEGLRLVFTELTPLLPLSGESLARALVEPAKREGVSFEEGLVEEMLEAVEGARGALPLLAFAVSRLWEKRDREKKLLTRAAYEEIGGVAGALAQHAEQTLERIGSDRQALVREMFRNLVTAEGTRASSEREELLSVFGEKRASAEEVLEELIDARLLTSYEATEPALGATVEAEEAARRERPVHRIEVVHESLLKAWPRLVMWQAQEEEGAVLRDQLKQAAHLWEDKDRPEDLLWTGSSEREFEVWRDRYPGQLTAVEDDFARAMVRRVRRARRVRRLAFGGAFAIALLVATVSAALWRNARAEARRAEASKLLALAQSRLGDEPTEALVLATASLELADTREARVFALRALTESPPALELDGHGIAVKMPIFSPDGRWLAASGHEEEAGVWEQDGKGPLRIEGLHVSTHCPVVPRWPSRTLLAIGLGCGLGSQVQVWSLPEGERVRTLDFGQPALWGVGPNRVFAATQDGAGRRVEVRSWTLPDGEARSLGEIRPRELGATNVAGGWIWGWGSFDPGGEGWLYAEGAAVMRQPLPAGSGRPVLVSRHPEDVVTLTTLGRASEGWVSIDRSGEIHLNPASPASAPIVLQRPDGAPDEAFPAASGRWIVALTGKPREARLWDTTVPSEARPLRLRRGGSWSQAQWDVHPSGDWAVVSTHTSSALTFWPLRRPRPAVIDGYDLLIRPLAFSPDSRLLATWWSDGVRLWPTPGNRTPEVRRVPLPEDAGAVGGLTLAPDGRFVLASGDHVHVIPLDGGPPRRLEGFGDEMAVIAALSPSGRRVAGTTAFGPGPKQIRVWDLEGGETLVFDSPTSPATSNGAGQTSEQARMYEGGVWGPAFVGENTLYTAGDGGVWRWDLESGTREHVSAAGPGPGEWLSTDGRTALVRDTPSPTSARFHCATLEALDTETGAREPLPQFGCPTFATLDPSGTVAATGDVEGVVRVGRLSDAEPHLLLGHEGAVEQVAISPDLRWVASSGEDSTLRLWPMPNLDKPPLHTLPHDELLAKLESLTNLRAVRDPDSSTGWTIEVGPFPGWKNVPDW
jgi:WD40 repeat protein